MGRNIYSIVFLNSVIASLAGKKGLEVEKADAQFVSKQLKKLPDYSIRKILCDKTSEMYSDVYSSRSMIKLAGHVVNAVNSGELNKIIYVGEIR